MKVSLDSSTQLPDALAIDKSRQGFSSQASPNKPVLDNNEAKEVDFSSPNSPKDLARDNRVAGEFEVPSLNEYALHGAPAPDAPVSEAEPKKKKSDLDLFFEKAVYFASGIGVFGGISSSLANAVLGKDSTILKGVNASQNVIARLAIGSSALVQAYNNFRSQSLFKFIGYTYETLLSVFSPFKTFGLHRGLCFMLYHIPEIVSSVRPLEESKSFAHDYSQIASRAKDAFKMLFSADSYSKALQSITKHDEKHEGLLAVLLGAWGSLLSTAGVGLWMLTGDSAKGGLIKGIGEGLVDLFQVAPNHWKRERNFFIGSGLTFLVGTVSETVSKLFGDNPVLANLYFAGTTLGRLQFALSEKNHETEYIAGKGPPGGWEGKETYAGIFNKVKNFMTGKVETISNIARNKLAVVKKLSDNSNIENPALGTVNKARSDYDVENSQRQVQKNFAKAA